MSGSAPAPDTSWSMSTCARNLPQHFNGCACTNGSAMTAEVDGIDLIQQHDEPLDTGWRAAIRGAFQARTLRRLVSSPSWAETAPRRLHHLILDHAARQASPATYSMKRSLKRSLTRGSLACAAVLSIAIGTAAAGHYDTTHDAVFASPGQNAAAPDLVTQYGCSDFGLPEGVEAVHALVLDKTDEAEHNLRLVSFERGREIYESGREDITLVAVCSA